MGVLTVLETTSRPSDLPPDFECYLDLPDEECAAIQDKTQTAEKSGIVSCSLCGYIIKQSREETPDDGTGDIIDIEDDEDTDGATGEATSVGGGLEVAKDWTESERLKYPFLDALSSLQKRSELLGYAEAEEFSAYIRENKMDIVPFYMELMGDGFFSSGITIVERAMVMTVVHRLKMGKMTTPQSIMSDLNYEPGRIREMVSRALRVLSGEEESEVIQFMRVYAPKLSVPESVLTEAIEYFREAGAPPVARSAQVKAVVWLALTMEVSTVKKFNASEISRLTGINRRAISEVRKEYADFFAMLMATT
jgi:hypothetical protein